VSDVFDLSTSYNLMAPSSPISLPVLSENNENEEPVTAESEFYERCV
jgi:hypothetical protein